VVSFSTAPPLAGTLAESSPPERILMAPGPSNLHPRVLQALIAPLTGHKDPYFLGVMEETADLLRAVFVTENRATLALPATGGSGMEAALINALSPGDTVVIGRAGFFAHRMVEITGRLSGVTTIVVDAPWGQPIDLAALQAAIQTHRPRAVAVVHGETSTGVEQPLAGLGEACHAVGALLLVDAVATLGGVALPVDELGIDICYSGSQKCLSAPPGVAPITISPRALSVFATRQVPVQSWYLDLALHARFWDTEHIYHHTAPILHVYALREALRLVLEEGLPPRLARHRLHASALRAGLAELGLQLFAQPGYRLDSVVTLLVPPTVSASGLREVLLDEFNLEIGGGLGEYADRMLRVGVMGHSARRRNIMLLLDGLAQALARQGLTPPQVGAAAAAADLVYRG
jgi:alanine-glyoxylate transaminase/serine-glyoxylate transaminase/serine-pyruvate transaminase